MWFFFVKLNAYMDTSNIVHFKHSSLLFWGIYIHLENKSSAMTLFTNKVFSWTCGEGWQYNFILLVYFT